MFQYSLTVEYYSVIKRKEHAWKNDKDESHSAKHLAKDTGHNTVLILFMLSSRAAKTNLC